MCQVLQGLAPHRPCGPFLHDSRRVAQKPDGFDVEKAGRLILTTKVKVEVEAKFRTRPADSGGSIQTEPVNSSEEVMP